MENLSNNANQTPKSNLRIELKKIRDHLSPARREEASSALLSQLLPLLGPIDHILSFSSFGSEIDTSLLNLYFARTQRLFLPKMVGECLKIFQVTHLKEQLTPNAFGLYEPNPMKCLPVENRIIQTVLVPGIGFDLNNHRLGYGKGCYDRFLKQLPHLQTIGVGFKEQLTAKLPIDTTDVPLMKVCLF